MFTCVTNGSRRIKQNTLHSRFGSETKNDRCKNSFDFVRYRSLEFHIYMHNWEHLHKGVYCLYLWHTDREDEKNSNICFRLSDVIWSGTHATFYNLNDDNEKMCINKYIGCFALQRLNENCILSKIQMNLMTH